MRRLDWESLFASGLLHDARVEKVRFAEAMRDVAMNVHWPWRWDKHVPFPGPESAPETAEGFFITLRFCDVVEFSMLTHRGECFDDGWDINNPLGESIWPGTDLIDVEIDGAPDRISDAETTYGGRFRSAHVMLTSSGREFRVVFRDCVAMPSDWDRFELWRQYPQIAARMPQLVGEPLNLDRHHVRPKLRKCRYRIKFTNLTTDCEWTDFACSRECLASFEEDWGVALPVEEAASGSVEKQGRHELHRFEWDTGEYPKQRCYGVH